MIKKILAHLSFEPSSATDTSTFVRIRNPHSNNNTKLA
jgi:hypothetical protein